VIIKKAIEGKRINKGIMILKEKKLNNIKE
jgi:hypothetical protein